MSDFFRLIGEWLQFLWPLRKVNQWERGLLYRWGRFKRELKPGIYWLVPWFHEIKAESVVRGVVQTPRIDITLRNGSLLTVQAAASVRVTNLERAVNAVDAYMETTQEDITAVLAEKLADVDAGRLEPAKRKALMNDLKRWTQEEVDYGIEIDKLRFTTFVLNPRPFRLMGDNVTAAPW